MTSTPHPFRFGVVGESVRSGDSLRDTARKAEALGYSTFLLRDHLVAEPFGDQLAPLLALTSAAEATTTLRIGTLVLDNDYRHPVMLAKEAATLDALSGGRFELGIGAGWLCDEYDRAGMPFDRAGVRVDRLSESLRVLKNLLGSESTSYSGDHYSVTDLTTFPRPVQRPHPPILLGAGSPRMLRLAGREADIVGILPKALPGGTISDDLSERKPETIARKVSWIREGAGARFDDVELSMMVSPLIADDHRAAAARLAAQRGWDGVSADAVLEMPTTFAGPVERIVEVMGERRETYGFSYYVVSDTMLDPLATVVDRLTGT